MSGRDSERRAFVVVIGPGSLLAPPSPSRKRGDRGRPRVRAERPLRRAVESDPQLPLDSLLGRARAVLATIALHRLDRAVLAAAGAISERLLRTLDAVHVVAAVDLTPLAAFVTYDDRQATAARLAGLRTAQPGS